MSIRRDLTATRKALDEAVTEAELQACVVELAQRRGWLCHHCRPGANASGRVATQIQGDAGFPDLVLVRSDPIPELLIIELKREEAEPSKEQTRWLRRFEAIAYAACDGTVEVAVWRPSNWSSGEIERRLA